jgi:rfaE bifunctional protein nucleotidyltransferase chain/domain
MSSRRKIVSAEEAQQRIRQWKSENEKIAFTNGCFDIIHLGHVDYLEKTAELADRLIVGVNTDDSVRRLKGPQRPVQDQIARSRIMAGFEFVDLVILFDEDTPLALIEALVPDVLVKGNDYSIGNIVGADFVIKNGGVVETIELVSGYSTSNIIEKIKRV